GSSTDFIIPVTSLTSAGSPGIVYISFTRDTPTEYTLASFQCTLKFITKQLDLTSGEPEEEGYADEYQLEEVKLGPCGDYIVPNYVTFSSEWDRTDNPQSTSVHTLQLSGLVTGSGGKVLVRSRMTYSAGQGVTLELTVQVEKEEVTRLVVFA
ncbi:hypothetical protein ARMSODRAFT_861109, partial [Armillaria solidipes]